MTDNFEISLLSINWIDHTEDEEHDYCAHGKMRIVVGKEILSDANNQDWCVSTAALFLLRTLTSDHSRENPVFYDAALVNCCAWPCALDKNSNIFFMTCNSEVDWYVTHNEGKVILTTESGEQVIIPLQKYKKKVVEFAQKVEDFFSKSKPKIFEYEYDEEAYVAFWQEWQVRKMAAMQIA